MLTLEGIQVPSVEGGIRLPNETGKDVSKLCSIFGLRLDPWQEYVIGNGLSTRNGSWANRHVLVSVPRQQGKTAVLEARALAGVLLFGERTVIVCAHEVRTTLEIFNRISGYFENYPELKAELKRVVRRAGDEAIVLNNGCRIKFISRSKRSGRGFTADALLLDEAQILDDDTWSALLPTTAAAPNPQIWMFGTPPGPNDNGEVFGRLRAAVLGGKSDDTYLAEWSAKADDDFDDPATWAKAMPSLGGRVHEDTIRSARASMSDESFGREILGIWGSQTSKSVIPSDVWLLGKVENPGLKEDSPKWLCVDISPDREQAAIGVAEAFEDGHIVYVAEHLNGTAWIEEWIVSRLKSRNIQAVVVDTAGPAASLIDPLKNRGVPVIGMSINDVKSAVGRFYDAVMSNTLYHLNDPLLNSSVGGANKRNLGDAWAWNKKNDSVDITPLVAVTYAHWATEKGNATPTRKKVKVSNTFYALN